MRLRLALGLLVVVTTPAFAQQPTQPTPPTETVETGWEWFGLPTLNFNSDEGFGYGALLQLYNYGNGTAKPYRFMIRPLVLFTTKGRRDFTIELDAPGLLGDGWRLDAFAGLEKHLATPYYGIGNETEFDETLKEPPNDYYYTYGRTQWRFATNVQRRLTKSARFLVGVGFTDVETDPVPFDSGTTLFADDFNRTTNGPSGTLLTGRVGVTLDTRDREIGPRGGHWIDLLAQEIVEARGPMNYYSRFTLTARKYWSINDRLVFAQRIAGQATTHGTDGVPIFDYSTFQAAVGQSEALGGSSSVRGIPRNRFIGRSVVFSNSELRWRFKDLKIMNKSAYMVASAFVDAGRVWDTGMKVGELFSDLHAGYGGGWRLGLGPSFLIAFDVGKSSESTQIYIGLGYPF
jgi:outer membrane protein assembly factor BamA